jgi:hypothetical protein
MSTRGKINCHFSIDHCWYSYTNKIDKRTFCFQRFNSVLDIVLQLEGRFCKTLCPVRTLGSTWIERFFLVRLGLHFYNVYVYWLCLWVFFCWQTLRQRNWIAFGIVYTFSDNYIIHIFIQRFSHVCFLPKQYLEVWSVPQTKHNGSAFGYQLVSAV